MEKIETHIDEERDLTVHTIKQQLGLKEFQDKISEFFRGKITRFRIWDFSEVSIDSQFSSDDASKLVNFASQFSRPDGKTALVAPNPLDYGCSRMLETYMELEQPDFKLLVCRNYQEALDWFNSE